MCCPISDLKGPLSTGNMAYVTEELDFKYLVVIHFIWIGAHVCDQWHPTGQLQSLHLPSLVPHRKYSTAVGIKFRGGTKKETHTSSTDS